MIVALFRTYFELSTSFARRTRRCAMSTRHIATMLEMGQS